MLRNDCPGYVSSYPHSSSPPYSGDASDSGDITIAPGIPSAEEDVTSDELSSRIRKEWKPPLLCQRRLMSASVSYAPVSAVAEEHPPAKAFTSLFSRTELSKRVVMDMHHSSTRRLTKTNLYPLTFVQSDMTGKSR